MTRKGILNYVLKIWSKAAFKKSVSREEPRMALSSNKPLPKPKSMRAKLIHIISGLVPGWLIFFFLCFWKLLFGWLRRFKTCHTRASQVWAPRALLCELPQDALFSSLLFFSLSFFCFLEKRCFAGWHTAMCFRPFGVKMGAHVRTCRVRTMESPR